MMKSLLATLFATTAAAASVQSIVIKGQHFFYENGTEFFMRGVAYQQDVGSNGTIAAGKGGSYVDPLADASACQRDIPWLVKLRTNVIRVYAVDPSQNHDECMSMLADAGIYVLSDLTEPDLSINRNDPSWNYNLYNRYTSVIDMFAKYSNVIGFFAGNEVSNEPNVTAASAFVKAAVRDSKAYIKNQGYKNLGVGYATYDGPIRAELADYFSCGSDSADTIDFWGYNCYSWCGTTATFQSSQYAARTAEFATYPVPVFFAEYGCNQVQPRQFTEDVAIYGPQMTGVWSGGIVYMYFQEANNYGLVNVNGNTVSPLPDYYYLSSQMAKANPSSTSMAAYSPTNLQTPACPSIGANWGAAATPLPPTPNQELCNCMESSLTCVVSNGVSSKSYANIFNYVCGADPTACNGIAHKASIGDYGDFSTCDDTQQLGYVMNQYYINQNEAQDACDFSGSGTIVSAAQATGDCSSLLSQAGKYGNGQVSPPTGAASGYTTPVVSPASGVAGATGSTGASASTSTGAASSVFVPSVDLTLFSMGLYVFGAFLTGAGMILL